MKHQYQFSTGERIEADITDLYVLLDKNQQYLQNYIEVSDSLDDSDYIVRGNGFCDTKFSSDFIENQIIKYQKYIQEINLWIQSES